MNLGQSINIIDEKMNTDFCGNVDTLIVEVVDMQSVLNHVRAQTMITLYLLLQVCPDSDVRHAFGGNFIDKELDCNHTQPLLWRFVENVLEIDLLVTFFSVRGDLFAVQTKRIPQLLFEITLVYESFICLPGAYYEELDKVKIQLSQHCDLDAITMNAIIHTLLRINCYYMMSMHAILSNISRSPSPYQYDISFSDVHGYLQRFLREFKSLGVTMNKNPQPIEETYAGLLGFALFMKESNTDHLVFNNEYKIKLKNVLEKLNLSNSRQGVTELEELYEQDPYSVITNIKGMSRDQRVFAFLRLSYDSFAYKVWLNYFFMQNYFERMYVDKKFNKVIADLFSFLIDKNPSFDRMYSLIKNYRFS
jgi:hypothetical protein